MNQSIGQVLRAGSYQEKLNSEEWRDYSRQMRKSKGNFCESCRRADVGLNVHHVFYDPQRQPWEFGEHEVAVLCFACHKEIHVQLNLFRRHVFGKMNAKAFAVLNRALSEAFDHFDPLVFCHALSEFVLTDRLVEGYAKGWGMRAKREERGDKPYVQDDESRCARIELLRLQAAQIRHQ